MRADDLILFSQVVELGSFSKVAEQNNLTNSVVSKRIARLMGTQQQEQQQAAENPVSHAEGMEFSSH